MSFTSLRIQTRVLPDHWIEVDTPELPAGVCVELIIIPANEPSTSPAFATAWEYLQSLSPTQLSPEAWGQIEREFKAERDAWDD
jgi:hypothetical protein